MWTRRLFLGGGAAVLAAKQGWAFSGSEAREGPLKDIKITVSAEPAVDGLEPIVIDSEHGKALVKMGPVQAGQFMANILSPRLEQMTGIDARSWHWVLTEHLTGPAVQRVFEGGGTGLQGMQFSDDNGRVTWGVTLVGTRND
ncbi:hypothetical protein BXY66_1836 [Shimia isoporae]|uniref:Uncharacterized protein n=1 Tax=Shimia isoporae TaxID=647720 RepID=A0A4R1NX77_9RHOB|nr:hypothetical protein [Shimia isoporae]TCL09772.1 hypothetical protein BXY66_1836 [Shimia isoporae]